MSLRVRGFFSGDNWSLGFGHFARLRYTAVMRRLFIFLFTAGIAAAAPAGKVFVDFAAANAWETGFTGRINSHSTISVFFKKSCQMSSSNAPNHFLFLINLLVLFPHQCDALPHEEIGIVLRGI